LEFYQLVVQGTAKISVKITKLYRNLLIQSFKLKVCSNSRVTKETTEKNHEKLLTFSFSRAFSSKYSSELPL
jgi:hypothetical protein